MPLSLTFKGEEESTFEFQRGVGGQYWSKGESTFKIPLEYIKLVRGKTYTNRKWQMKWNPHHHHKMVGFTLEILQRHLTYGYMGRSQWWIQDILKGGTSKPRASEGCLEAPSGSRTKL